MRPCILLAFALLASFFCGCVSLSPDVSMFAVEPISDAVAEPAPSEGPQEPAAQQPSVCDCPDDAPAINALNTRLTALEVRVSLQPYRGEQKPTPKPPQRQAAQVASDCAGGFCGPRLLPRGRIFGRR